MSVKKLSVAMLATFILVVHVNTDAEASSIWTIEDGIRLEGGWPHNPDIVKLSDGEHRMYYADCASCPGYPIIIRSAISPDGLIWTKEDGIRIGLGYGGQENWAGTPEITILPDGTYRMYYSHERYPFIGPLWGHILSAVSTDGLTWTKDPGIRVDYGGTYDELLAIMPNIVKRTDGIYRMYYSGYDGEHYRILSVISSDGLTWTKEEGIRIDIGGPYDNSGVQHPKVIQIPDGMYFMFYQGWDDLGIGRILSAVSPDGVTWTKEIGIRIGPEVIEGVPYSNVNPGEIIKLSGDQYRMYFCADTGKWEQNRYRIFSATAKIPQPITVEIDIKPGSYPNAINLGSHGLIPVAILSNDQFDATTVNPETVELAGADVAVRGKGNKYMAHEEDVNGNGLLDLVVRVGTANLDPNSSQDGFVILTGKTYDYIYIEGADEITIVPLEQ